MLRIDKLTPGDFVELEFCGSGSLGNNAYDGKAVFLGIIGEGDDRTAKFAQSEDSPRGFEQFVRMYEWEAYRYNGHWAYGTSAERLRLLRVLS